MRRSAIIIFMCGGGALNKQGQTKETFDPAVCFSSSLFGSLLLSTNELDDTLIRDHSNFLLAEFRR